MNKVEITGVNTSRLKTLPESEKNTAPAPGTAG